MAWPDPDLTERNPSLVRYTWDMEKRRMAIREEGMQGRDVLPPELAGFFCDVQVRSGFAIDAGAYFMDPEMPLFLKEDANEPPFYALIEDGNRQQWGQYHMQEILMDHPSQGHVRVKAVMAPATGKHMTLLHTRERDGMRVEDFVLGPGNIRCGYKKACIIRQFIDATTNQMLGQRTLNDTAVITNRRDPIVYAATPSGTIWTTQWFRRFDNSVMCRMYNNKGAVRTIRDCDGLTQKYMGPKGNERIVSISMNPPEARGIIYEANAGPKNGESVIHRLYEDGKATFFHRLGRNHSVLYKVWYCDGKVEHHEGDQNREVCVSTGYEPRTGTGPFGLPRDLFGPAEKFVSPEALERWSNTCLASLRARARWQSWCRRALKQARADAAASAELAAEAARQRAVREDAAATAASKSERAYTQAGPSHQSAPVAWVADEATGDAGAQAKRCSEKAASIEAARAAAETKKAAAEREAEAERERLRYLQIGEDIVREER